MAISIKNNFLKKQQFLNIENFIMGNSMPWFFGNDISHETKNNKYNYYFTYRFFNEDTGPTIFYNIVEPLIKQLKCKKLIRVKANLYPSTEKIKKHGYHKDYDFKHKACLFYINNNNGYNYFKKDNKKTKPKANTAVFFDPSELHCSSSCSDQKRRVTININYE
jgi:hypothetical protein|tara:strand:+ start:70 stop:561 length:492 start_codon:yes stop_codon:yes gene_type:complete